MPTALFEHLRNRALRHGKEPGEVDRDDVGVVLGGVIGERLGDEDASVVDQRVDPAELLQALANDLFGGGGIADVTLNGKDADVFRRLDGARVRYYRVAEFPVGGDERLSDPLRGPGDDGNLLDLVTHDGVSRFCARFRWFYFLWAGSFGCGVSGVTVTVIHTCNGRLVRIPCSCCSLSALNSPSVRHSPGTAGGFHNRRRWPAAASSAARLASRAFVSSTAASSVPSGTLVTNSVRNSMTSSDT